MNSTDHASAPVSEQRPAWAWPVLLTAVLAVSTGALFVRLADPAPALVKAAWRCTLASLVLLAIGRSSTFRAWGAASRSDRKRLIVAGFLLALHFATWVLSLSYTTVTSSMVLVSTVPAWTAILAPWLGQERTTSRQWQGIGLCAIGIAILALWPEADPLARPAIATRPLLGSLLALTGAVSFALFLIIGRDVQRRMPSLAYLTGTYGSAAAFLLLACAIARLPLFGFPTETYGWLIALALVPQLIGHTGYNLALRFFSAATVAILLVGEPIFGSVMAWLVLAEPPGTGELIGGAFLLAGILRAARA